MSVSKELREQAKGRKNGTGSRGPKREVKTAIYPITAVVLAEVAALSTHMALRGGAVRFGLTRDGGALALGMYLGDDVSTEYIRPSEDISVEMLAIVEAWTPEFVKEYQQIRTSVFQGQDVDVNAFKRP